MNRLMKLTGGAALAAVAMFAAAPAANAQHHGGFSGGAWHGSGSFHGGGSWGGSAWHGGNNWGGNWNGGWHGGPNSGGFRGYGFGWGYPGFSLAIGLGGFGYGYGYGSVYASGYTPADTATDFGGGVPSQPSDTPDLNTTARLDLRVPADATVWVEGVQMTQTGTLRTMISPSNLEPGKIYHYTVKAQWTANGQQVTEQRTINVQPGLASLIDFTKPADPNANTLPAPKPSPAPPATPAPTTPPAKTPPVNTTRAG
jgi:uncharacterized protein (TIGR03000 family)